MSTGLFAANLRVPPISSRVLARERLVGLLEEQLPARKVMCVSTPAGYGRTTLLALWARQTSYRVVWFALDPEDDDPGSFFRGLTTAWSFVEPGIRDARLTTVLAGIDPDPQEIRRAFVDAGQIGSGHTVFVLDDVHVLRNEEVLRSLAFLFDHMPLTLHFILSGRAMPSIPLARYLSRGELLRLDADDLRFSLEETGAFLRIVVGEGIRPEIVADLHDRLEGWVAGLQLAALSLRKSDVPAGLPVVTGRHRFIADYLREEVLARLPEDDARFVLQTSVLDRLSGPLCDAVTGHHDSVEKLEALERANLFLEPLDDNREWYRYHRLFADVLREELARREPETVAGLHQRAAQWHLHHHLPDAALRHAIAGDDVSTGLAVIDRHVNTLLNTGRFRQLEEWISSIPALWKETYPILGLPEAGMLLFSGALEAGMRQLEDVERRLGETSVPDTGWQLARTQAVRCFVSCFMGDVDAATYWADQSLPALRDDDDLAYRVDIYQALGDSYRSCGRWDEAESMYRKTLQTARGRMPAYLEPHVYGALADLELLRGNLRTAHRYWTNALTSIGKQENFGLLPYPLIGWVHLRMGELVYEWNDLETARAYLTRGRESAELGGDIRWQVVAALLEAQVSMAEGNLERAATSLDRAETMIAGAAFPDWATRLDRLRHDLMLRQGSPGQAIAHAERLSRLDDGDRDGVATGLAVARVLTVAGGEGALDEASRLLDDALQVAVEQGRRGIELEACALKALIHQRAGAPAAAMLSLEESLRIGEREGYIRTFVDLGAPMMRLLQAARVRQMMPEYVERLLSGFGTHAAADSGEGVALPEPLTPREMEVLHHMAAGLTNDEIAEALFISPETVKKHGSSIFGKLGVANRTEAAARARELDLLADR